MNRLIQRAPLLLALGLALAGCSSGSSPIAYYLLTPTPSATGDEAGQARVGITTASPAIQVAMPAYTDRPQIVFQNADGTVDLQGNDRWAESADGMVKRVLTQDIAQRASPALSQMVIAVVIDDFIFTDNSVRLSAHWTMAPRQPATKTKALPPVHRFTAQSPVQGRAIDTYVQAMSGLVGQLATAIAP